MLTLDKYLYLSLRYYIYIWTVNLKIMESKNDFVLLSALKNVNGVSLSKTKLSLYRKVNFNRILANLWTANYFQTGPRPGHSRT